MIDEDSNEIQRSKNVSYDSINTINSIVKEIMSVVYKRVDSEIKYIDEQKNTLLVLYTKSKIKESLIKFKYEDAH